MSTLVKYMSQIISLDDFGTWPANILSSLRDNADMLAEHAREQTRIDRLGWTDVRYRINPPPVRYAAEAADIVQWIDDQLVGLRLRGFHCTRLLPDEIHEILRSGMQPLSTDFALQRINNAVAQGALSSEMASKLLAYNAVSNRHGRRLGMTYFTFGEESLCQEDAVWRLFGHWGGEAIYWGFESDDQLRRIGRACIVDAAIPIDILQTYSTIGARLTGIFLQSMAVPTELGRTMDGHIVCPLAASNISGIIGFDEPEFLRLTNCESWTHSLA